MLEFVKHYWIYILYCCQLVVLLSLTAVYCVKNRRLKLIEIAEKAVEEAEKLVNATAEQKKAYAVALIKQELKVKDTTISNIIEQLIDFSKLVNSKRNLTIQEVLSDDFKKAN